MNQHDEAALKGAEKTQLLDVLKQTNIKFDLDERGAALFREQDREQYLHTMGSNQRLPMRTIGEERESRE